MGQKNNVEFLRCIHFEVSRVLGMMPVLFYSPNVWADVNQIEPCGNAANWTSMWPRKKLMSEPTWPLQFAVYLAKICGIAPVKKSRLNLLGLFCFCVQLSILLVGVYKFTMETNLYRHSNNGHSNETKHPIFLLVIVVLMCVAGISTSKHQLIVLEKLQAVHDGYGRILFGHLNTKLSILYDNITSTLMFCTIMGYTVAMHFVLIYNESHIRFPTFTVTMFYPQLCKIVTCFTVYICNKILQHRCSILNKELLHILQDKPPKYQHTTKRQWILHALNNMHGKLCEVQEILQSSHQYAILLAVSFFCGVFLKSILVIVDLYVKRLELHWAVISITITQVLELIFLAISASNLTTEVQLTRQILSETNHEHLEDETKQEMKIFLFNVSNTSTMFYICGTLKLNTRLAVNIIVWCISTGVVLIHFVPRTRTSV